MSTTPTLTRRELTGWLVRQTSGLLSPLAISVVARIVGQLLGVALLVVAVGGVTSLMGEGSVDVPVLVWTLVGLSLAKAVLRYGEHYAGHWVAFSALARLRQVFFTRLVPQAPAATQGKAGAELTDRATRDIDRIETFFAHTFPPAVAAVTVPLIVLVWFGAAIDAKLALTIAPFVLLTAVGVPVLTGRRTWQATRDVAERRGEVAAHVGDDVQGVREVLSFDIGAQRLSSLAEYDQRLSRSQRHAARMQAVRAGLIIAANTICAIAVLGVGVSFRLDTSHIAAGLAVAVALWGPARGVDDFVASLDSAFAAAARVHEVVEAPPKVVDPPVPVVLHDAVSSLRLNDVTFSYTDSAANSALRNVTIDIPTGHWSYIVGVSGSGKSTVASLLVRGWDPDTGAVLLNGHDIRDMSVDTVRRRIGLVPQRPTMVTGTMGDNLRLAAPDAPDDLVLSAVNIAGLSEWVDGLPQRLDTELRERGLNVSGGELQRLALARALVAEPDVLVLDEALSQLDTDTYSVVRDRLCAYRKATGMTIIEITHRLDLIDPHAWTVVVDGGRVRQQGSAESLRGTGGAFDQVEARL